MSENENVLLVQIAGNVGRLTQLGETQTGQISELFKVVNELKSQYAEQKGGEKVLDKTNASNADKWARGVAAMSLTLNGLQFVYFLVTK